MADQWCQLTSAWLYSAYLLSRLSTRVGKADIKGACSALQARVSRIKCLQMDIFAGARAPMCLKEHWCLQAHAFAGARVCRRMCLKEHWCLQAHAFKGAHVLEGALAHALKGALVFAGARICRRTCACRHMCLKEHVFAGKVRHTYQARDTHTHKQEGWALKTYCAKPCMHGLE
eukprot:174469-Pelagomonas_calceolata.AAC.6